MDDVFQKDITLDYQTGKYVLRFDFIDSIFNHVSDDSDGGYTRLEKPKFWIKEISTSRKELRLFANSSRFGDDNKMIIYYFSSLSSFNSII